MTMIFRFKYIIVCLTAIAMLSDFSGTIPDNTPDNVFEATLMYGEDNMQLNGTSTYTSMPGMVSFYLEDSEPVTCSIHILKLGEEGLKKGKYIAGIVDEPRAGVVCGVPYSDEHDEGNDRDGVISKERVSSTSGEVKIEEVTQIYVSGSFDVLMKGNKSDREFRLSGKFTSHTKM